MPRFGLKKSYKRKNKPLKAARFSKTKRDAIVKKIRQVAKQTINRNIETKTSQDVSTEGYEIFHNNFVTLSSTLLKTGLGTADQETGIGQRIGDDINLRGVSIKIMLELNERYSDVTFRVLCVKCARGDVPTRGTLFVGNSGNKMMDDLNRERYTIIGQKYVKLKAPNMTVPHPAESVGIGSGIVYESAGTTAALSRATKIVRMWIPGSKFSRSGKITYVNSGYDPKFFDYHVVCYAYSNYSTAQDVYYVGRVNEFISRMYYKDA